MAMRLYDISDSYAQLQYMLEDAEDASAILDTLESIEDLFDSKVENIVKLMRSKMADHAAVKAERERLKKMEDRIAKQVDWLEHYVETNMKLVGRDEVKSNLFSIKLRLNPPSLDITDETVIPDKFKRIELVTKYDKVAMKEAIAAGEEVPGTSIRQEKSLQIK